MEEVEERARVSAHERAREAEGLAAGVGEDAGGDALGGAAALVLVDLVADQEVEEAPQVVLHIVGEGVALRPRAVRLPEGAAALVATPLAAGEVLLRQRQAVLVDDGDKAVRAAGHPEWLQRLLVPDEPAVHGRPALDHVPSFLIDTKRCATLGEPHCLHEAGRGRNSEDWPCRVDSAVSHSRTNIGMSARLSQTVVRSSCPSAGLSHGSRKLVPERSEESGRLV